MHVCLFYFFWSKFFFWGQQWFLSHDSNKFVAWSYCRVLANWEHSQRWVVCLRSMPNRRYWCCLMLHIPALRFEVLHSRVSLVGCKDRNLLAIWSFSGWNYFILWKKRTSIYLSVHGFFFFCGFKYRQQIKTCSQDYDSFRTSGVVISLLPVQDDKGRAALHSHYCKVGGWRLRGGIHIRLSRFVLGEVVEGRCDRARFIWFLACLVDDVRGFGTKGKRNLLEFNMTREAKPPACTKFSFLFSF